MKETIQQVNNPVQFLFSSFEDCSNSVVKCSICDQRGRGTLVQASLEALCCTLEQGTLSSASTALTHVMYDKKMLCFHAYVQVNKCSVMPDDMKNCFCLFCCFTSQVNSYGHGGTVSSPNHTFSWASLNKHLTSNLCT